MVLGGSSSKSLPVGGRGVLVTGRASAVDDFTVGDGEARDCGVDSVAG